MKKKATDKLGLYPPPEELEVKRRLTQNATDVKGLFPPPKQKDVKKAII